MRQKLRDLGFASYGDYLRSSHWLRTRREYKQRFPWQCLCGEKHSLQLHHLSYENLGAERPEDLQPLCERCHSLIHDLARNGQADIALMNFFDIRRALQYRIEREERARKSREGILTEAERRELRKKIQDAKARERIKRHKRARRERAKHIQTASTD